MEGEIIKVNRTRGYGFIRTESSQEYFFHKSDLVMIEIDSLEVGNRAEFELDHGPRGLLNVSITLATSIKIIEY
ncbi:cold-shock protein [Candidatus Latescibacterota bacterium]